MYGPYITLMINGQYARGASNSIHLSFAIHKLKEAFEFGVMTWDSRLSEQHSALVTVNTHSSVHRDGAIRPVATPKRV